MNANKSLLFTAVLILAACAEQPPALEQDFGNSVRQMVNAQTADPATVLTPPKEAVEDGDGPRSTAVMKTYRERVVEKDTVEVRPVFQVGGGN